MDDDQLKAHLNQMKAELMAHSETVETRLLTEFWKWARTSDVRARQHGANLNAQSANALALDVRLSIIEERVSDLERAR
jgi:hypothetical protein